MSKYHEDLDYLIKDVDISKTELEEIIVEADKIISDADSKRDKLIEAYLKKAQCLQKLNQYAESKTFLDKLLDLNPNMPEALARLGIVYDENKEYDKAIEEYNKSIELKPDYAVAYNNRGVSKYELKDYRGAIEDYDKAIELNPDYAVSYNNRGNSKYELKDYRGAIEDYDKAIELNPDYAVAYNNRGVSKDELKDYRGAIEDFDKAIELNPGYAVAYNNRGNSKNELKDYRGAIEDYDKSIELNPDYAVAYNNRGVSKENLSDYRGAIEDYDKAIELNPDDADAYINRGNSKYYLDDYHGAIEDYNKAIELNPDYANARHNRGIAYKNLNDYENAAKDFYEAKTDILNLLISEELTDEEVINFKFMLQYDDFFKREIIKKCKKEEIDSYGAIYLKSLNIVAKLLVKNEIEMSVSHYTKREVLEKLLFDDYFKDKDGKDKARDCFRLNSVNTSNDPTEGKILFHYLFPRENMSSQVEKFGAFAGCFILNNDSLNQFRLYGKEKNEEGTGVSITLNKRFFSEENSLKKRMIGMEIKSDSNKLEENSPEPLPLFRCIYMDPEMKEIVSLGHKEEYVYYRDNKGKKDKESENKYLDYRKIIDETQEKVSKSLKDLNKLIEEKNLNQNMVYSVLLRLRYLVKHAAFREEQECRIINIVELNYKDRVKMDTNVNNRLYVDYLKLNENNVEKICFAPKAEDIDKFKQHLARNNFSGIECSKSKAPLA